MDFGDWGLGIGDWGLGPIPNPQSPFYKNIIKNFNNLILIINILNNFFRYIIKNFNNKKKNY